MSLCVYVCILSYLFYDWVNTIHLFTCSFLLLHLDAHSRAPFSAMPSCQAPLSPAPIWQTAISQTPTWASLIWKIFARTRLCQGPTQRRRRRRRRVRVASEGGKEERRGGRGRKKGGVDGTHIMDGRALNREWIQRAKQKKKWREKKPASPEDISEHIHQPQSWFLLPTKKYIAAIIFFVSLRNSVVLRLMTGSLCHLIKCIDFDFSNKTKTLVTASQAP